VIVELGAKKEKDPTEETPDMLYESIVGAVLSEIEELFELGSAFTLRHITGKNAHNNIENNKHCATNLFSVIIDFIYFNIL
jgi:hypothetical protein